MNPLLQCKPTILPLLIALAVVALAAPKVARADVVTIGIRSPSQTLRRAPASRAYLESSTLPWSTRRCTTRSRPTTGASSRMPSPSRTPPGRRSPPPPGRARRARCAIPAAGGSPRYPPQQLPRRPRPPGGRRDWSSGHVGCPGHPQPATGDGSFPANPEVFLGGTGPGEWRPTLPAFAPMLRRGWAMSFPSP